MPGYEQTFLEIVHHVVAKHPQLAPYIENAAAAAQGKDQGPLDVLATFPLFVPYSAGVYKDRVALTVQTINQIFPFLGLLAQSVNGALLEPRNIETVPDSDAARQSVAAIKERFDFHGSDKATFHNYQHLYGTLLADRTSIGTIFEIGLGTHHADVVSNMGQAGKPGASLRAFRDYCPNATVVGADIDKRVLFAEERITTHYVDQTDPATFDRLQAAIPAGSFDLFIDDGLHSANANIASLRFGLAIVKKGGWVVIEDIGGPVLPIWQVVAALLPAAYAPKLYKDVTGSLVFVVRKPS